MARIRSLKPEFWQDEKLSPLEAVHRLVFLGLISMADDTGRIVDSPKLIDGLLFPHTDDVCAPSLKVLAGLKVIERGPTTSGQRVIQIVGWEKHQKIEKPNLKSALPPITTSRSRDIGDVSVISQGVIGEDSPMDRGNVGEASHPPRADHDLRSTTYDLRSTNTSTTVSPREETDGPTDDLKAEMTRDLEAFAERAVEPSKRSGFLAKAQTGVVSGEDYRTWEDGTGSRAPWPERPRILRLALAKLESGESQSLRGALKYVVAQQLDPDRQRTGQQGQPFAQASPGPAPALSEAESTARREAREAEIREAYVQWETAISIAFEAEPEAVRSELEKEAAAQLSLTKTILTKMGTYEGTLRSTVLKRYGVRIGDPSPI